jgi:hypothetical protein
MYNYNNTNESRVIPLATHNTDLLGYIGYPLGSTPSYASPPFGGQNLHRHTLPCQSLMTRLCPGNPSHFQPLRVTNAHKTTFAITVAAIIFYVSKWSVLLTSFASKLRLLRTSLPRLIR